jgi:hypothetical protein
MLGLFIQIRNNNRLDDLHVGLSVIAPKNVIILSAEEKYGR